MKISSIWMVSVLLLSILLITVLGVQKKMMSQKEKWIQFECGFNGLTPSHIPFSFQFFLIALLFLIFDVEIALVLSYPMEATTTKNMIMIFLFVLILTLGLLYEWQKSKIKWSTWTGSIFLASKSSSWPRPLM